MTDGRAVVATSRLRMAGYAAIIAALAFAQSPGRMVADTKFDLLTNPLKFVGGGLHMWDGAAAFGQVQNQAYGYLWPMGPFFVIGHLVSLPAWVTQRLWWTLLIWLAFHGVVRLARELRIGTPTTQVLAGFAFVLTPRMTTVLGGSSIEVWPMALAPWVLLPLVIGAERGSVRRMAGLSALVIATCGGVNAVAVSAVLPLPVLWLLTRPAGPRRWRLAGWWSGLTVLATLWWVGPLLLIGRYTAPFLDYIENATLTTLPTDLTRTLSGQSDWVAFFGGVDYAAGRLLASTGFLILDAAVIVAIGVFGLLQRDCPQQRFLLLGVLTGLVLVGFGYHDDVSGFWSGQRHDLLDGSLAAFRNVHKYDVVLRIPLLLGLAHALARIPHLARDSRVKTPPRLWSAVAALALVALALPWVEGKVAPTQGVEAVPGYWQQAARYLGDTDNGTVSLVMPAATFGVYTWGNVHDDIMQGLADSHWAVRNVIPLADPGNVSMLDAITRVVEDGHPSATLAPYLAGHGVGRLLIRNDLDRLATGAPDPSYVRAVLQASPGLTLVRSFGPLVEDPASTVVNGVRVVNDGGTSRSLQALDVYRVRGASTAWLTDQSSVLIGGPGAQLRAGSYGVGAEARVLAGDAPTEANGDLSGTVLTDGLQRREKSFAAVRWNESPTMTAGETYRLPGREHEHRLFADQGRWQTTEVWTGGVSDVIASTSVAYADAYPPMAIGSGPSAALDHDPATAWASEPQLPATGQWWQADLRAPSRVASVRLRLAVSSSPVTRLVLSDGSGRRSVPAPAPGHARTYRVGFADASYLRITSAGRDLVLPGTFSISEVRIGRLVPQRFLALPPPEPTYLVDDIELTRDPDRQACQPDGTAYPCDASLLAPGEDGDTLARLVNLDYAARYAVSGTASLRRTQAAAAGLLRRKGLVVRAPTIPGLDPAQTPLAIVDGDPGTTWTSPGDQRPIIGVRLPRPARLRSIRLTVDPGAAAAAPTTVVVSADGRSSRLRLDADGRGRLPGWRTDHFSVAILATEKAFAAVNKQFVALSPGVSDLRIDGRPLLRDRTGTVTLPCGSGPDVELGATTLRTRVTAPLTSLVRDASVPFRVCGPARADLQVGANVVLARPTSVLRVDSLTLRRRPAPEGGGLPTAVRSTRDGSGIPRQVALPSRLGPELLTVSQNFNAGWHATLDGRTLTPQRVDGWMQGWWVPAGAAASVVVSYAPGAVLSILLVAGGLGLLAVVLLTGWRPRKAAPAALGDESRGLVLDVLVVVAAAGLLAGWWGLLAAGLATGLRWWRPGVAWAGLAAVGTVAASLTGSWQWLDRQSWSADWGQGASLLVVAALGAALLTALRRPFRRPARTP